MKLWRERQTWQRKNAGEKLAALNFDSIKSIAVIKHAAYGDLLCTRPFLVTLKKFFPSASITFCNISHYTRGTPDDLVDRVFVTPGKNSSLSLYGRLKAFRKLGEHDLLFDLTASTPSFFLSLVNKAKFKIGFQHRKIHRFIYDVAIPRAQFRFEAETFLEQLHILGIQYELPLDYAMPVEPVRREKPYVVYFPTASSQSKSWPAESFATLIAQAAAAWPELEHIILSGLAEWEIQYAKNIHKKLKEHQNVLYLSAGDNDAGLIKSAKVLVANDTGIRHLGIATGTTTVGIFFDTTPFGYWPRFADHEVVFNIDGRIPAVDDVMLALARVLDSK
jgi:ADP-heptose:LPS heptosyltransferase